MATSQQRPGAMAPRLLPGTPLRAVVARVLAVAILVVAPARAGAGGPQVYQPPEEFLARTFPGGVPAPAVVWLRGEVSEGVKSILGHRYPGLRIRYWRRGGRSAWILEEVGKTRPITTGIVVADGRVERLRVLVFRESRGWEVRHPFFTEQFDGARLDRDHALDRPIDGVSGATLSVRALKRLARLALFLDRRVRDAS